MRGRTFLVVSIAISAVATLGWVVRSVLHRSEGAAQPAVSRDAAPKPALATPVQTPATRQLASTGAAAEAPPDGDGSVATDASRTAPTKGFLLHVVDAETKSELEEVTLLRQEEVDAGPTPHPGEIASRELLAHGRSPLRVQPPAVDHETQRRITLWVGAPDHVWSSFEFESSISGERTVELRPAAALVVDVQGVLPEPREPDDAPELRLRRSRDRPGRLGELIAELPARLGAIRIDGLAAGEITASVEIGSARWSPLVVGSVAAKLVEHQTTHATLVLQVVEWPEPVPFAGTLFVPEGWSRYRFDLVIRPLDLVGQARSDFKVLMLENLPEIPDRPGWHRWSAGRVHPATYRCEIDTFGFAQAIKVEPPGDENVELIVSDATNLIVHVVDRESGEPIALDCLYWRTGRDSDRARATITFHHRGDDRCFEATVPIGPGAVETSDFAWLLDDPSSRAEIHAGSQELIVRARKACGVLLNFTRDGKPADPLDDRYVQATLEAIGHDGSSPNQAFELGVGLTFYCTAPGRYRVTIPRVAGDEPIAPFEVDLPPETILTRVVELEKVRVR